MTSRRTVVLAIAALAAGIAIALIDSSPGWDSDGITAFALAGSAGAVAFAARRRPWLWALLVGLPTPILEIAGSGNSGAVLAVAFAASGAIGGWAVARVG